MKQEPCTALLLIALVLANRSIHLSNVAVQENYINGKRCEKIPANNFMTSEQLKEYLW